VTPGAGAPRAGGGGNVAKPLPRIARQFSGGPSDNSGSRPKSHLTKGSRFPNRINGGHLAEPCEARKVSPMFLWDLQGVTQGSLNEPLMLPGRGPEKARLGET